MADLKGLSVAFGAAGSGLVILSRYVLDGIGLDQTKDFKAILLERAGDGPAMVRDGRAAALWGGGSGWPGFTNLMKDGDARFIAPSADEIHRVLRFFHFYAKCKWLLNLWRRRPGRNACEGWCDVADAFARARSLPAQWVGPVVPF